MNSKNRSFIKRSQWLANALLLLASLPTLANAQVDPANSSNPVDYAGSMHNQALDFAIEARREVGTDIGLLAVAGLDRINTFSCLARCPGEQDPECNLILPRDDMGQVWAKPEHTRTQILEGLSGGQRDLMIGLYELLASLPEDPQLGIEQIRELEVQFAESGLSNDELEVLYGATSVARHSLAYWSEQASLAAKSRWNLGPVGHPGDVFGDPETLEGVITADVDGYVWGRNHGGFLVGLAVGAAASFEAYLDTFS